MVLPPAPLASATWGIPLASFAAEELLLLASFPPDDEEEEAVAVFVSLLFLAASPLALSPLLLGSRPNLLSADNFNCSSLLGSMLVFHGDASSVSGSFAKLRIFLETNAGKRR